jgi:hypothetical protein
MIPPNQVVELSLHSADTIYCRFPGYRDRLNLPAIVALFGDALALELSETHLILLCELLIGQAVARQPAPILGLEQ